MSQAKMEFHKHCKM